MNDPFAEHGIKGPLPSVDSAYLDALDAKIVPAIIDFVHGRRAAACSKLKGVERHLTNPHRPHQYVEADVYFALVVRNFRDQIRRNAPGYTAADVRLARAFSAVKDIVQAAVSGGLAADIDLRTLADRAAELAPLVCDGITEDDARCAIAFHTREVPFKDYLAAH